ncbi:transmembrane protein, putative (macronuclear) [Tetrahymena thermophila SB210]|uniref:Transmembrane protein, putative n=1 Tax=Tetrahymena thermophila (strain SB210) TaxID=312017 RepID=Q23T77_TETTS|nr:transmembrane protein, putative [Tetrahymena thermophila SB210]EAR99829.2 transmembrane protein, putative [Tetrahymena thermophila SB210]|eukprot:XP_001020074.2 transmembrane protein, putative [Tetrahymena thermophila SB210]
MQQLNVYIYLVYFLDFPKFSQCIIYLIINQSINYHFLFRDQIIIDISIIKHHNTLQIFNLIKQRGDFTSKVILAQIYQIIYRQAAVMSIQENRKEVQVSREYNLLTSGKNDKPSYLNGKHANKLNQDQTASQLENSCSENNIQQCGSVSNSIGHQNSATAPYQRNGNTSKQSINGKSAAEEKKINDEKQQKKNDYSEIQQILKSCTTEAKGLQDQDDDEDDVEFEIVSYEDSSEDEEEMSKMNTEDENEKNASGNQSQDEKKPEEAKIVKAAISEQPQQNQQQQQEKQIQQLGLRVNTSSEKEDEHIKNESSEEDIFSEYAKIGSGYAQFNLPKLLQDINTMENHKKEAENQSTQAIQSQQNATQQQKDLSSTIAVTNQTFDKTRNKQAQNKSSTVQQQQNQEQQHKTVQQRIQYCHQQLSQKRVINTRSSGAGSKGNGGLTAGKSSYNNQNNTIGNDYQPKYISSRKRRAVTDPELESLGLLNKRRDTKNNTRYYNEESETTNQDLEDDNDESEEETQRNKKRQQQAPKPKSVTKSSARNSETSHQKPQNTSVQNKKKAEQSQNVADDDYPDVPITLPKDQQMELLKYHKRSKNYHGTAKQFGISHEEARVIVKKLKKEYRSITNY